MELKKGTKAKVKKSAGYLSWANGWPGNFLDKETVRIKRPCSKKGKYKGQYIVEAPQDIAVSFGKIHRVHQAHLSPICRECEKEKCLTLSTECKDDKV